MRSIILIFLLTITVVSAAASQSADTVYVRNFAVNIRTGPGLDYDKAGVVYINTPLRVISGKNDWFEIIAGDTLDGWIAKIYTSYTPLSSLQSDKTHYHDGDMQDKLYIIAKMTKKHSGPEFEFLCDIILNHHNYDMGQEADRILLPEIFKGWTANKVTEAVPVLSFVMEQKMTGQIGNIGDANREVILAAKTALKALVRE